MHNRRFKLPSSLDVSFLDLAVTLTKEDSAIQMKRQITIRVLFIAVVGILLYTLLAFYTPLMSGGIVPSIIWSIGYIWLIILFCAPTLTKQVGMNQIRPMINYLQKANREVGSRTASPVIPLKSIVGIEGVVQNTGKIVYSSNEVGYVYEVVGNASILMFESDTEHVMTASRNFHRKLTPHVAVTFDSATEPQRVERQVAHVLDQKDVLKFNSPQLQSLMDSQIGYLSQYVGREFKSLHQYMVVRAKNDTALHDFDEWVRIQIEKESGFLTDYRVLDFDEVNNYLREVYTAVNVRSVENE